MGRVVLLALAALTIIPAAVRAETAVAPQATPLNCNPTGVWSSTPPGASAPSAGPQLAAVDTDVRPRHTRLYLDGRYVGDADDFDGSPDVLYLRPGRYRLECRLGGYTTAAFDIDARAGCSFKLRQRMERVPGTPKEHWWERSTEVTAGARVFEPLAGAPPAEVTSATARHGAGPDLALRPDIPRQGERSARPSLRLTVEPSQAAVYLDGACVGTGADLAAAARPLTVRAGAHRLEVVAPGFRAHRQELEVAAGQTLELRVVLEKEAVTQP